MKQIETVNQLTIAFNESWNDSNPTERLNPELIDQVNTHFHYAFVAGLDAISERLLTYFKQYQSVSNQRNVISINDVRRMIEKFEP